MSPRLVFRFNPFPIAIAILLLTLLLAPSAPPVSAGEPAAPEATSWLTTGNALVSGNFLGSTNSFPLIFKTNKVERMRIIPGGNIGIGTTGPSAVLSVVSSGAPQPAVNGVPTALKVGSPSGTIPLAVRQNASEGSTPTMMWLETSNGGLGFLSAAPSTFVIGAAANKKLGLNSGGQRGLTVAPNGYVGVGTTSPTAPLTVATATNSNGLAHTDGIATVVTYVGTQPPYGEGGWVGTNNNYPFRVFANAGTGIVNVYPSGEVGVGSNTVYGAILSVQSTTARDALRLENTTSTERALTATSNGGQAIMGRSDPVGGIGVLGYSENGDGIYGYANAAVAGAYAGYFQGNVNATGSYSIRQDNPLNPANQTLSSVGVSSNQMLNVFSGNATTDANGEAVVRLPDYFDATNRDPRYQLTVIGQFAQAIIASKEKNNSFVIKTDKPNVEVSWQVTAIRNDPVARAYPFQAVQDKPADQRGTYINPELFGQPSSASTTPQANIASGAPATVP